MRKSILSLTLVMVLLSGCAVRARTPRIADEWGRANLVGMASRPSPVGLVVTPDGGRVIMAWPARSGAGASDRIHLLALDGRGAVLVDQDLEYQVERLEKVQLSLAENQELRLTWLAGRPDEMAVWRAQLSTGGFEPGASLSRPSPNR